MRGSVRYTCIAALVLGCSANDGTSSLEHRRSPATTLTADQCVAFAVDGKTRICHATGAGHHPFTSLNVSIDGCESGHSNHPHDYVAVGDPSCRGGGCLPQSAPCDDTLPCCDGLTCSAGKCTPISQFVYVPAPAGITHAAGESLCQTNYAGHLASVHSAAQEAAIDALIQPCAPGSCFTTVWIGGDAPGGFCSGPNATYAWTDGTPWDYQNWRVSTGEPNCTGVPGCIQLWPANSQFPGWNDVPCDGAVLAGVICETNTP
jgi:hypothetical protein